MVQFKNIKSHFFPDVTIVSVVYNEILSLAFKGMYKLHCNALLCVSTYATRCLVVSLHFYLVSKIKVMSVYIAFSSRLKIEKLPSFLLCLLPLLCQKSYIFNSVFKDSILLFWKYILESIGSTYFRFKTNIGGQRNFSGEVIRTEF